MAASDLHRLQRTRDRRDITFEAGIGLLARQIGRQGSMATRGQLEGQ